MAKYYFHIRNGEEFVEDVEGIFMMDIAAVQEEAVRAAREMVADLVIRGQQIDEKRFEVEDEKGDIVLILPFRLAIPG